MDKEHVKSAARKAEGTLKEAKGKAVGDKSSETKGEMKGKMDKAEVEIRDKVGDAKDAVKKAS